MPPRVGSDGRTGRERMGKVVAPAKCRSGDGMVLSVNKASYTVYGSLAQSV